jgi:hypothetical protein
MTCIKDRLRNLKKMGINTNKVGKEKYIMTDEHKQRLFAKGGNKNPLFRIDINNNDIIRMSQEGLSQREIAKKLECSQALIKYRLKFNQSQIDLQKLGLK